MPLHVPPMEKGARGYSTLQEHTSRSFEGGRSFLFLWRPPMVLLWQHISEHLPALEVDPSRIVDMTFQLIAKWYSFCYFG